MPNPIDENANGQNRIKITKRSVESLEPLETAALIRYDEKLAGFGVRVMPSGRRFYFARYRNEHGRSRWFTIGEHGRVTAGAARTKAQRILQTVAVDGRDPSGEREAFRAAPTVNDLLDRYIKEHLEQRCRSRTIESFKGIVERDIRPELGHLKVAGVTRQDLRKLHAAILRNSPRLSEIKPISENAGRRTVPHSRPRQAPAPSSSTPAPKTAGAAQGQRMRLCIPILLLCRIRNNFWKTR